MFEAIGDIIDGRAGARGRTPVRRHSHKAGHCEGLFWRRTDRQTLRQIVTAARRYELVNRQPGERNGPLGSVALEVLDYLANRIDLHTGRLEPSLDYLMRQLRRSRDAIVRALSALRRHGFLDWLRRYVPIENEGRGPRVKQTSNAYRLSMPERARRLLGRFGQPAPLPDDFAHARQQRAAVIDAHRATLETEQRLLFDDHPFAEQLGRMWRNIQQKKERESAAQSES